MYSHFLYFMLTNCIFTSARYRIRDAIGNTRRQFLYEKSENEMLQNSHFYFEKFKLHYSYAFNSTDEEASALKKFQSNLNTISYLNRKHKHVKFRANEYSILSFEEFSDMYTGFNDSVGREFYNPVYNFNIKVNFAPEQYDYRNILLPTYALDQGECKSSYVFSALGNIEAQVAKYFHFKPILSAQYGYECEPTGNCEDGGMPHLVMSALANKRGIIEADYYQPYSESNKSLKPCRANETLMMVKVTGSYLFKVENEEYLKYALLTYGPLSVAIYVGEQLKNYASGILDADHCKGKPNHAVLLVGYGVADNNVDFWVLRNSWGREWGEEGYFRLRRGKNACGILSYIATATVESYHRTQSSVPPIILPEQD